MKASQRGSLPRSAAECSSLATAPMPQMRDQYRAHRPDYLNLAKSQERRRIPPFKGNV